MKQQITENEDNFFFQKKKIAQVSVVTLRLIKSEETNYVLHP